MDSTNSTKLRFLFTENLFQSLPKFESYSFKISYITLQFINGVPFANKTKESRDCTTHVLWSGADPGFLLEESAKGMMTLYGMGMSDF